LHVVYNIPKMKQRKLRQYQGHLSTHQIADGMNASAANAERLAFDAQILLNAARYPSAASLAILSLEESGKMSILRELATSLRDGKTIEIWRRYRRHTEKNYLGLIPDLVAKGARTLRELGKSLLDDGLADRIALDIVKQLGLYTDCCGDAHWSIPAEIIDKDMAHVLVSVATGLAKTIRPMSEAELELWVTHMQSGLTKENLLRWAAAMVSAGLKPAGYIGEMTRFTEDS
jgi:AbiV family abortive infection protein